MAQLVRRSPVHNGIVLANQEVTPRMRRVSVQVDALRDIAVRPAQDFELHLRDADGRKVKRRYTIRAARPAAGEFDLDVALHGDGPGAAWGAAARPGDAVELQGPRGKLELGPARWHLLVGDESALPAIASICTALPANEPAHAVLEIADGGEEQALPGAASLRWLHRDGRPAGSSNLLLPLVETMPLPGDGGHAYLLGETRTMVALRAVLERRGIAHDAIFVKGYWNLARLDRLAGQSPAAG